MVPDGSKMAPNQSKQLKMAPNRSKSFGKWFQIGPNWSNCFKWLRMPPNESKWPTLDPNCSKWLQIAQIDSNWSIQVQTGPNMSKLIQIDSNRSNKFKYDMIWSKMVHNLTKKNHPNGSGITRSPGLVSSGFKPLFHLW